MIAEQLLLFEEPLEGKLLREIKDLKASIERVRKGQFAKIGQLRKDYDDLKYEFETLKAAMCRPSNIQQPKEEPSKKSQLYLFG